MKRCASALWLATLPACLAAPTVVAETQAKGPVARAQVTVRIEFEPPLAQPGWLTVQHEAGSEVRLPTGRSGVELALPPGPASLRLEVEGHCSEQPVMVRVGMPDVVWRTVRAQD